MLAHAQWWTTLEDFRYKKELQIYNYGKSLFERLKYTTSWDSLGQKATIFVLTYLSLVKFECKQTICNDGKERSNGGVINDYIVLASSFQETIIAAIF